MKLSIYLLFSLSLAALVSSQYQDFQAPAYFPKTTYDFEENPLTAAKIELGRALFYDPILSRDSSVSCASCHSPYNAFAHTDHDLSHGIDDEIGTRNAPALFNLAWQERFMWDGAIHHLDMQALAPITHPKEMDESLANVVKKMKRNPMYVARFEEAFGDGEITGEYVLKALSQFQLTLVSASSKYDSVRQELSYFDEQETKGYALFQRNCNSCHQEPLFSTYQFAHNGLPIDTTLNDSGRWAMTKRAEDQQLFKIPSLRNISYTRPYMHDGRFDKLREVLNHYTDGIQTHPNLAPELQDGIQLSSNEKADLIAFLRTLNDKNFVFDSKHQFPRDFFTANEGFSN